MVVENQIISIKKLAIICGLGMVWCTGLVAFVLDGSIYSYNGRLGIVDVLIEPFTYPEALISGLMTFVLLRYGIGSFLIGNNRTGYLIFGFWLLFQVLAVNYLYNRVAIPQLFFSLGVVGCGLLGVGFIVYAFTKVENRQTMM